jgi:hypothetical protein
MAHRNREFKWVVGGLTNISETWTVSSKIPSLQKKKKRNKRKQLYVAAVGTIFTRLAECSLFSQINAAVCYHCTTLSISGIAPGKKVLEALFGNLKISYCGYNVYGNGERTRENPMEHSSG